MSFDVETQCACCGEPMGFTIDSDLRFTMAEGSSSAAPLFLVPLVDFTRLKAPSIVDAF